MYSKYGLTKKKQYLYKYKRLVFVYPKQIDVSKITSAKDLEALNPSMILWTKFYERAEADGGNYTWCRQLKKILYCNVVKYVPTSKYEDKGISLKEILDEPENTFSDITPEDDDSDESGNKED